MQRADPAAIEAEIERIRSLGVDELRKQWRMTFGSIPPRALTKDLIARMITYRLQEEAFGGLDRATVKLLDRLAAARNLNSTGVSKPVPFSSVNTGASGIPSPSCPTGSSGGIRRTRASRRLPAPSRGPHGTAPDSLGFVLPRAEPTRRTAAVA
jgi:hypothetical protein